MIDLLLPGRVVWQPLEFARHNDGSSVKAENRVGLLNMDVRAVDLIEVQDVFVRRCLLGGDLAAPGSTLWVILLKCGIAQLYNGQEAAFDGVGAELRTTTRPRTESKRGVASWIAYSRPRRG